MRAVFQKITMLLLLLPTTVSFAQNIDRGMDWLKSQQEINGSYKSVISLSYQATDESVFTGEIVKQSILTPETDSYLSDEQLVITELLSRQILYKNTQGKIIKNHLVDLESRRNIFSGGYAEIMNHDANVLDTAYALLVLSKTDGDNEVVGKALGYLLAKQNSDGGFSINDNESSIYPTALVLSVLNRYKLYFDLNSAITKSKNYLINNYSSSEGWGSTWETAYSLLALYPTYQDNQSLQAHHNWLLSKQLSNGSFEEDTYTTALALRAIYAFDNVVIPPVSNKSTVSGVVLSATTKQPIVDATITLQQQSTQNIFINTDSSQALFTFSGLLGGDYLITVSASGYNTTTGTFSLSGGQQINLGEILLEVESDGQGAPKKAVITGVVKYSDGTYAESVTVSSSVEDKFYIDSTDKNGVYSIDLPPGDVKVEINHNGYHPVQGSAKANAGDILRFDTTLIKDTEIEPQPTALSVKGLVVDKNNQPIKDVKVSVDGKEVYTDASGNYTIDGLLPQSYSFVFSKDAYVSFQANTILPNADVVTFSTVTLYKEVPVATTGVLEGVITYAEDGSKAIDIAVEVIIGGKTYNTKTNIDGFYNFSLPAGEAVVRIDVSGYESIEATGEIILGGKLIANAELFKSGSGNSNNGANITVKGTITDESDTPLEGVLISIVDENDSTTSLSDGSFEFNGLVVGEIKFKIEKIGYYPQLIQAIIPAKDVVDLGVVKLVKEADPTNPIVGTYAISGVVTDAVSGLPLESVSIAIRSSTNQQIINKGVMTAVDGSYQLDNVIAGNIIIGAVLDK